MFVAGVHVIVILLPGMTSSCLTHPAKGAADRIPWYDVINPRCYNGYVGVQLSVQGSISAGEHYGWDGFVGRFRSDRVQPGGRELKGGLEGGHGET